jgi:hypothetical protein
MRGQVSMLDGRMTRSYMIIASLPTSLPSCKRLCTHSNSSIFYTYKVLTCMQENCRHKSNHVICNYVLNVFTFFLITLGDCCISKCSSSPTLWLPSYRNLQDAHTTTELLGQIRTSNNFDIFCVSINFYCHYDCQNYRKCSNLTL